MIQPRRLVPLVLLAALALRVWGLAFGLPAATARPDETQIAGAALGFLSGDLKPPFFEWPMLFAYVVALAYIVTVMVGKPFGGWASLAAFAESRRQNIGPFLFIPRVLSAALGVAAVWWTYRLCKRAFDETTGLVAALFLALAFLHVRDSHFGVTDQPMTALVVCSVLLALRWRDDGSVWSAVAAGVVSGLATSTKYNGALVAVAFLAAWWQRLTEATAPRATLVRPAAVAFVSYGAAMVVAFLATSPYLLFNWSRFIADTSKVGVTLAGGNGAVVGLGYAYYATTLLPAAIGWPMFVAGVAGVVVLLATRFRESIAVLAFPIVYYAIAGSGYGVFARYILPVVPFLCVTAAFLVVWLARLATKHASPLTGRLVTTLAALVVVAPTARNSILLDRLLARMDNRVIASREVYRIVPPGSSFYQSGESYGQAPPILDGHRWPVEPASYDAHAGRFAPSNPDWILVQRSPLVLFSAVPAGLEAILKEHYLVERVFPTGESPDDRARFYDQQDAFFVPLAGLAGLERPGPAFVLYKRRN